jgi:hypothetical protein
MHRTISIVAVIALATAMATAAQAAPCRDSKTGKFVKCTAAAAAAPTRCRDEKTKRFAKCGKPHIETAPSLH